jgi:type IV pilus assembly protein PilX
MSTVHPRAPKRQRGAALVVGLIMLVVLTILAITGMNVASTELVMAGTEQDRVRAFGAAETGIERAARSLWDVDAIPGNEVTVAATAVDGSSVNAASGAAVETYETTTRYRGESACDGTGKSTAFHFDIESVGTAARGATSTHTLGVYTCNFNGGGSPFVPWNP